MYGKWRRFNSKWLDEYDWLEYSVTKDAAFCFYCYLFQDENINQGGGEVFSSIGFTSWNKKKSFNEHIGGPNSVHNQSRRNAGDLMRQKQSIQSVLAKQSDQQKWYTKRCDNIAEAFKKAPKNNQLTSPYIQRDIITACKMETVKYIIKDLNDDYFSILVDESRDVSCKEQMAIVLRRCDEVQELLSLVSDSLNMVGASFKHRDELRESQAKEIEEALCKGELKTGRGLNQELGLARAGDTRWGSHYKSFKKFILMFGPIIDVLDAIAVNARFAEKCRAKEYLKACLTFEVVFMLHFKRTILAITNELNAAFQKKEKDIVNAMLLVGVTKKRLQKLREEGWDSLIDEVSKFCIKYDISIPKFDEFYVILGRSRRRVAEYTILHHCQVAIFYKIIDWQHQELNNRFDEETTDLLLGIACLNPTDSFSSFNIEKILRLAELYPGDFDKHARIDLRFQLENYIVDVRDHDKRFSDLKGLCDFSKKLVETKKHGTYPLVFRLVKFALLLPVATATVERAFSAMKLIKTDLRNRMDDELLSGCLDSNTETTSPYDSWRSIATSSVASSGRKKLESTKSAHFIRLPENLDPLSVLME
ncbi:uncharacterized protein LOC132638013 [Lycium barbarum]|uniref:uncharacterized protein LOC132638013 n=1 Tax=Lycium barbarum TaxID=112863 RepID=UPI00293F2FC1|nr:uncharacterized protein LOC132638013 [Lycium barbarum]